LSNIGAKLAGEFSRIDYQEQTAKNSFRSTTVKLPPDTWGLYYRDEVGNISTSRVRRTNKNL
jgi:oligosaccharyltransferase complex subunit alpha (ribophorin I)